MWVAFSGGGTLGVPLAWVLRLQRASAAGRAAVTVCAFGLHWEALDKDVSVAGLLAGQRAVAGDGQVARSAKQAA